MTASRSGVYRAYWKAKIMYSSATPPVSRITMQCYTLKQRPRSRKPPGSSYLAATSLVLPSAGKMAARGSSGGRHSASTLHTRYESHILVSASCPTNDRHRSVRPLGLPRAASQGSKAVYLTPRRHANFTFTVQAYCTYCKGASYLRLLDDNISLPVQSQYESSAVRSRDTPVCKDTVLQITMASL